MIVDVSRLHRATAVHDPLTNDDKPDDFGGDNAARAIPAASPSAQT
ncbi:hypothetical protein [Phytohabitans suffuscus]|uniref:Uncharacterized protein n=1 Tax=Phytohabitans suffuscus TaxID=624315 RepID=A0A6F8YQH9_9ACTN|nr:hypothetical protein [Phytohabitans suffuscus]BCB88243.1 hypothetical protein Psuf_055560 [Phytohabitans suffuscus]